MRMWLDDLRPPPRGWVWVRTVEEAIPLLAAGDVVEASMDHDLGEGVEEGYALVLWMAEHDIWPGHALEVHSANPVGAERMCGVIERYGPYRRVMGTRRFARPPIRE
ncbi:MAG TPA: cyclic-phosphate processing receiver domain-containing protein [Rubrobacteraceae bacterium]|nr:cyclic-phosphate processing receiver domain-containing protein [Rubrobacteraceae bacterium]